VTPRSRTRRYLVRILLGLIGFIILLLLAALLNLDWLAKKSLTVALQRLTGGEVRLGGVELGLRAGTFRIEHLVLANPPGFGDGPLLDLPELFVAYDAAAAATNALHFKQIRLNLAEVGVVVDERGRTNLFTLSGKLDEVQKSQSKARKQPPNFTGIDTLTVSLGRFSSIDLRPPARTNIVQLGLHEETLHNVRTLTDLSPLLFKLLLSGALAPGAVPLK
jgi:hypothetical protein